MTSVSAVPCPSRRKGKCPEKIREEREGVSGVGSQAKLRCKQNDLHDGQKKSLRRLLYSQAATAVGI